MLAGLHPAHATLLPVDKGLANCCETTPSSWAKQRATLNIIRRFLSRLLLDSVGGRISPAHRQRFTADKAVCCRTNMDAMRAWPTLVSCTVLWRYW